MTETERMFIRFAEKDRVPRIVFWLMDGKVWTTAALAGMCGISQSAAYHRLAEMEKRGYVVKNEARINSRGRYGIRKHDTRPGKWREMRWELTAKFWKKVQ